MSPPNISMSSRLDGFAEVPMQLSHKTSWNQTFEPLNAITENAPIIFSIPASPQFINLSRTRLKIRVKLTDSAGGDLVNDSSGGTDKDKAALVCNPICSIFKHVKLIAQGTTVTPAGDLYGYKGFIDSLFSATAESLNTLDLGGFYLDTTEAHTQTNKGFKARAKMANGSAIMEFSGRPALDILKQGKNLIDGVKLEFVFYPQDHEFCIQKVANHAKTIKYKIMDAKLTMRKEELDPSILKAIHSNLLKKNWNFTYPLTTTKIFNIPLGTHQFNASNIFLGKVPNIVLIYFVKATGYTGDQETNPYWFDPGSDISEILITKDGVPIPNLRPSSICLKPDNLQLTDTYETLLDMMGLSGLISKGLAFPQSRLAQGLFFYAANLNADTETDDHISPQISGNIDVRVKYSKGTDAVFEMFVMGEMDVRTEIDSICNVLHTFPL